MLVKENVFKESKRGLPSPFTWISDGLISGRKKAKWHFGISCFTLKIIITIFHAKRNEFCAISLQYRRYIYYVLTTEMEGRLQKLYPQGVKAHGNTHMKPFREQVKIGYELAQVC